MPRLQCLHPHEGPLLAAARAVFLPIQIDSKLTANVLFCLSVHLFQQWNGHRTEHTDRGSPSVLVVSGLKPSSAYVFRLFAADEYGHYGDPGEEVTFHTGGEQPTNVL